MKKIWFRTPAYNWSEALPIGNGRVGAMYYGLPIADKLQINEETLWSGSPYKNEHNYDMKKIEDIREAVKNRDYNLAQSLSIDFMEDNETAVYTTYGAINVELLYCDGQVTDYYRQLDLGTAVTTVRYKTIGVAVEKQTFVSMTDDVIVMRIKSDKPLFWRITDGCELQHSVKAKNGEIKVVGRCPTFATSVNPSSLRVEYEEDKESVPFCSILKVVDLSGKTVISGGASLRVTSDDFMLVFSIKTGFNGYDKMPISEGKEYENSCKATLDNACAFSFEQLKDRHVKEYSKYFDRVAIELDGEDYDEPTDERIKKFAEGRQDNKLITLEFDYSRYLTITGNGIGTQPTNLQGIWCDDLTPPWRSNYTVNINLQMNYWSADACDLSEMQEPLFNMLRDLMERGNKFGLRGWMLFHNTDLWRDNRIMTKNPQWGFSIMNGAWLCRQIWERYAHTRDVAFLEKNYDIMQGMADFLEDWMIEKDGFLTVCPSTSPENDFLFNGKRCAVTEGSSIDLEICTDFFDKLIKMTDILGKDSAKYRDILKRIKPVGISGDGRVMEWNEQFEEFEPEHRHFSHLYGFYPGECLLNNAENVIKTLKTRMGNRFEWLGFSGIWAGILFARLKNSEKVMECIREMLSKKISQNMLYRCNFGGFNHAFQIDFNYGFAALILEALVQSHTGKVELLPALPKEWKHGEIRGIKTRTGETINYKW